MNLKHSQLELARQNPVAFKKALKGGTLDYMGGKSRYRMLQLAIFHYHKFNNDSSEALTHLRNLNRSYHFRNGEKLALVESQLVQYIDDFIRLRHTVVECGTRARFAVGPNLFITGEIPRLDIRTAGGYSVCFFQKNRSPWIEELRFPILQDLHAAEWGVASADVQVGMYSFMPPGYEFRVYRPDQITQARRDLNALLRKIT